MMYGRRQRGAEERRNSPQSTPRGLEGTPVVYTTPRLSVNTDDSSGSGYVGMGGADETDTSYRLAAHYGNSAYGGSGYHSNMR